MNEKQLAAKLHAGTDLSPAAARQFVAGLDESGQARLAAAKTPSEARQVYEQFAAKRQDAVEAEARAKAKDRDSQAEQAAAAQEPASVEPTEATRPRRR